GVKSPSEIGEALPTWSKATTFSVTGAVIGMEFPTSRVALSEGRSPEMTGEPSVVKNTWPLLLTVTALVSVTTPATGSGFSASVGAVVSTAPILNGMLSFAPAIDRTSNAYGVAGSSPDRVAWVVFTPTRRPVL